MKLTLRDLFWLALVVALMLGWWIHQSQLKSELQTLRPELAAAQQWRAKRLMALGAHGLFVSQSAAGMTLESLPGYPELHDEDEILEWKNAAEFLAVFLRERGCEVDLAQLSIDSSNMHVDPIHRRDR